MRLPWLLCGILLTFLVGGLAVLVEGQIDTRNLSPCTEDGSRLCLGEGRFEVQATFTTPGALAQAATAAPLVDDTGTFWFFDPDNVELVVKVLDACSFADRFWVFAGGLTNVEVEITVRDTATGLARTYTNPQGVPFQPVQDTDAFATCDVQPAAPLIESVTANPDTLPPLQLSQLRCVVQAEAPRPRRYDDTIVPFDRGRPR